MIEIPPPTPELAQYVAAVSDGEDPVALYLAQGEAFSRVLLSLLPAGLALEGERVLDFGCGSGRFLRHLLNAGTGAVFEGCDIDEPSISWLGAHLHAPHRVFLNDPDPPLPRPDGCEASSRRELQRQLDEAHSQLATARARYDDAQHVRAAARIIRRGAAARARALARRVLAHRRRTP